MGSSSPPPGNAAAKKPWEQAGTSSGPTPFKPPSTGSTSNVVEASGTAKPGEIVSTTVRNQTANTLARPVPPRPWQQTYGSYGGYGYNANYNVGYGGYGGGLYGNGMYPGYGGMYNNGFGGSSGHHGMGLGGPYGNQDPNNPHGPPSSPPGFWISFLRVQMQGVVNCFGRVAILIDQNTQALHMFMSALLQLFDRSGLLYSELARFVLRILGMRRKHKKQVQPGPGGLPGPAEHGQQILEGPKGNTVSWDSFWG